MKTCPNCDSPIYSRKFSICGSCNEPLPTDLLFTEQEKAKIEEVNAAAVKAHKTSMQKLKIVDGNGGGADCGGDIGGF